VLARPPIICAAVRRLPIAILLVVLAGLLAAGCGTEKIAVPKSDTQMRAGAEVFNQRCSGCHTLDAALAEGSKPEKQVAGGERTNGPNFNVRKENRDDVLFAIRNGGFSGAIMPANIVVGKDADAVAAFVAQYAGKKPGETNENAEQPSNK
jgi:mono/diheme cytochrome c family protein